MMGSIQGIQAISSSNDAAMKIQRDLLLCSVAFKAFFKRAAVNASDTLGYRTSNER